MASAASNGCAGVVVDVVVLDVLVVVGAAATVWLPCRGQTALPTAARRTTVITAASDRRKRTLSNIRQKGSANGSRDSSSRAFCDSSTSANSAYPVRSSSAASSG